MKEHSRKPTISLNLEHKRKIKKDEFDPLLKELLVEKAEVLKRLART